MLDEKRDRSGRIGYDSWFIYESRKPEGTVDKGYDLHGWWGDDGSSQRYLQNWYGNRLFVYRKQEKHFN